MCVLLLVVSELVVLFRKQLEERLWADAARLCASTTARTLLPHLVEREAKRLGEGEKGVQLIDLFVCQLRKSNGPLLTLIDGE